MPQNRNETPQTAACLGNVKNLAMAFLLFEVDHKEVYSLTATNWKEKILPYTRNQRIFTCPLDPAGALTYSFNKRLAGKSATSIQFPAKTVLVYEGKAERLNFRHQGKAAVGFADGHVRMITKDQAKNLIWRVQ